MSAILTVTQLNTYIKFKLTGDLKLKGIAIRGEISNFGVNYRSGHAYFSLKDETGLLKCVMFSSNVQKLRFAPENGMNVLAVGNIDVYERDGVYQLKVSDIQPIGVGAVHVGLEQLKKKLEEKGIFKTEIKKPIPYLPKKLAVVTSPTGAALQDILNILGRRYPLVEVVVCPALVQGSEAPDSMCRALRLADRSGADTIILARGGGAQEDLMAFNTESVAMAIYACNTPIISAVGHETDTTIADYAADLRVPTPTAAASAAVPDISEIYALYAQIQKKLDDAVTASLLSKSRELERFKNLLAYNSPMASIGQSLDRLASLERRLASSARTSVGKMSLRLDKYAAQLAVLSPFNILDRGYSIVTKDGKAVFSADELSADDEIEIRFAKGNGRAKII